MTESGYISLVISSAELKRFKYDNPALADDNELAQAFDAALSFCGKFGIENDMIICEVIEGLSHSSRKEFQIDYSLIQNEHQKSCLSLTWTLENENNEKCVIECNWEKCEPIDDNVNTRMNEFEEII